MASPRSSFRIHSEIGLFLSLHTKRLLQAMSSEILSEHIITEAASLNQEGGGNMGPDVNRAYGCNGPAFRETT